MAVRCSIADNGFVRTGKYLAPVTDAELEAALSARATEHGCELVIEEIDNGLWRAALKTLGDPITPDGAIRLSAARPDRHDALQDLYDAGEPR
jgi:hypothetical protein